MTLLLDGLRAHLAGAGIVRIPRDAGTAPPMWLHPRDGVPAPGEGEPARRVEIGPDAVLGAFLTGGIPPRPYEAVLRRDIVDIRLRTKTAPLAMALDEQIRAALVDRRNWLMGGVRVIESRQWRAMQPLGSDAQAFDWVVAFLFETYAA